MVQLPRRERAVLDVIDHAYAGVLDPARWHDALTSFAALVDARAAGVRVEQVGVGVEQQWIGLEPSFDRAYVEHYWRDDPWAQRIWEREVGAIGHGDALSPRATVEASAFHNELARPYGFDDLAGGVLERTELRVVTFGLMKGAGTSRFDDDDDAYAKLVAPHFRRALSLRDRMGATAREAVAPPVARAPGVGGTSVLATKVEARLTARYGLTPAEARVAARIGMARSPKEIASENGSSWNTVRAQLRQIFAKTETPGQSALARLVTLVEADIAAEEALGRRPRR